MGTDERKELSEWQSDNRRDNIGLIAFAAWINVRPDQVPAEYRYYTCPATKEAWDRVANALQCECQRECKTLRQRLLDVQADLAKAMCHVMDYSNDPHLVNWAKATLREIAP